ncbi:MAG: AarF/ABC1/UbiB kinase family protein [Thermoflexales bacterium]|nr:AarF/ABC1/UbiB kinase family protein [Thermoflexales bacterium]
MRRVLGEQRVNASAAQRYGRIARRFRDLAVSMGGVLIKIGQFISSRVDVLPAEITDELAGLQDEVPAERFEDIRAVIEAELKQPLEQAFAFFDPTEQAAASLGQAHRGCLHSGENVVVKVQRPGIALIVDTDLAAVRTVLRWIRNYPPLRRRVDVIALQDEFSRTLYEELDYVLEAENALKFAANFADIPNVIVPRPYRPLSTRRVLVLEDVEGIKITDFAQLAAAGVERKEVAQRLFDVYMKQVFEDGFFHADPHPGNLFVHPADAPGEGPRPFKLAFVDFGMTGRVAPSVRTQLRQALVGLALRDPGRIVQVADDLGFFLPGADLGLMTKAMEQVFARFYGMSMAELRELDMRELQAFLDQFRELLFQMPIQLPQDYIYLGRTIGILSGMATGLDPDFNAWLALQPYAEQLVSDEMSGEWRHWLGQAGELLTVMLRMPTAADRLLTRLLADQLVVRVSPTPEINHQVDLVVAAMDRLRWTVAFAALVASGALLIINQHQDWGSLLLISALLVAGLSWLKER